MLSIDVHTHAFPDALAERAVAELERIAPVRTVGEGTTASLLASMDAAGIDASVVCTIATRPEQTGSILRWCEAVRSERIVPFASIHPDTPEPGRWVERIVAAGVRGIKLHAFYQDFRIDEPRMEGIYAAAEALGLVVQLHCGEDFSFPVDDRAGAARVARVLDRHRGLKVIAAHMGGWRMWEQSERWLVGRDVFFETSYSLVDLGPERAADMIRRHGVERVLFGTDWPWSRQAEDVAVLRGLALADADREKVLGANAAALLGLGGRGVPRA
ncbi:MAG TPA: amidohydrolase family protein [Phycisphaerae bacterium]|nr:amidohydrolase family protein [Phycisphaerae bacterium]